MLDYVAGLDCWKLREFKELLIQSNLIQLECMKEAIDWEIKRRELLYEIKKGEKL